MATRLEAQEARRAIREPRFLDLYRHVREVATDAATAVDHLSLLGVGCGVGPAPGTKHDVSILAAQRIIPHGMARGAADPAVAVVGGVGAGRYQVEAPTHRHKFKAEVELDAYGRLRAKAATLGRRDAARPELERELTRCRRQP